MSIPTDTTVILANRPRLFRELLHHALKTASASFKVSEVTDGMPSAKALHDTKWLIIDAENTNEAMKLAAAHPHLHILALDGRGSHAVILAPKAAQNATAFDDVPTLSLLMELLSHENNAVTSTLS